MPRPGHAQAEGVLAEQARDCRQEDERGEHDDEDGGCCRDGEAVEERHAEDEETEQRDDHGAAGKEDGTTGRAHGCADGLLRILA